MFANIPPSSLNDQDFKEDSVRELIIAPMVARLGYGPTGPTRVARSKTLQNAFIRVGTRNHPVTTVPDYTFFIDNRPHFVLDAKAPNEDILKDDHVQQAYSYAVHPEIRCNEFGLCNGRELAIFDVTKNTPLLHLKFENFEDQWNSIEKHLLPKYLAQPALRRFAPDFGFAIKRLGISPSTELVFLETRLNLFTRIDDSLMTASANCNFGSGDHCVSFDFHPRLLPSIVAGLPKPLGSRFSEALNRTPYQAAAGLVIELDIAARLGEETQGQSEMFIPLVIQEILASRFNPSVVPNDPNDIPSHVFKLRDAFTIKKPEEGQ